MENRHTGLSLGKWPIQPTQLKNQSLTPITKRILTQVHLNILDILPISYPQYLQQVLGAQRGTDQYWQSYNQQLQRRKRQVTILADIRNKYILGKDYNGRSVGKIVSQSKSLIKSRLKNKSSSLRSQYISNLSGVKPSNALSRLSNVSSQKRVKVCSFKSPVIRKQSEQNEDSDYFIHFNPHKEDVRMKLKPQFLEEESTKSKHVDRKKSVKTQRQPHQQYGYFCSRNTKIRIKKEREQSKTIQEQTGEVELCQELLRTMERWQQLDKEHLKEMSRMKDLTTLQKQRLAKMQAIQKSEMRSKIKRIKSRLNSQSQR